MEAEPRHPVPRRRFQRGDDGQPLPGTGTRIRLPTFLERMGWPAGAGFPGPHPARPPALGAARARPFGRSVYGPVASRRLGRSLGVDLTPPGPRVCCFDCVYCELGRTPGAGTAQTWPRPQEVGEALAQALSRVGPIDSITLCGHGEPTLHPRFASAVACVLREARRARPDVPVRILTNGAGAIRPDVRRALDALDARIVKLDAASPRVNRPDPNRPPGGLLLALSMLRDVTIQACFIEGSVANTNPATVRAWAELLSEIRPLAVQIYTIDRRPARAGVRPVAAERLQEIACLLRTQMGIEAHAYA